ncbi:MAG: hypothetical protein FJ125_12780, partial [Deltaproteobacteria bacterium]|nr:hypothetical protein [Deltaproteobacteria bacterium]
MPGGSDDRSSPELCNRLDDDCDGATDEGFGIGLPCAGVGACPAGVRECAGPDATRCSTLPGGSDDRSGPESCDGWDEDCDGEVDEEVEGCVVCGWDGSADLSGCTTIDHRGLDWDAWGELFARHVRVGRFYLGGPRTRAWVRPYDGTRFGTFEVRAELIVIDGVLDAT